MPLLKMNITNRLQELVGFYSLSNRAFAMKCGLKQATFDKQVRGITTASFDTLQAILNSCPEVSAEWLLRGDGNILKSEPAPAPDYEKMNRLVDTITILQETINEKNKTIQLLTEQVKQLKNQLNK